MQNSRHFLIASLRTVLPYAVFGSIWIWGSDYLLLLFTRDPEIISDLSMLKGWIFMVVTSILLFFLVLGRLKAYQGIHDKLDERQQEYEEFLFATSHHLRSPLVTISGFANEIARYSQENSSSHSQELIDYSSRIQHGVRQMEGILKSMTRLHRNLRERPNPEPLETEKIIRSIFQSLPHDNPPSTLHIVGKLPSVFADSRHFRILTQEIIFNSLQHRNKDSVITIKVRGETNHGIATIFFEDNGPGFVMDNEDEIFQPILRKQSLQDLGNIRMGLAIALRCARWNSGNLKISTLPSQGTTVEVQLPKK